ncbi:MAG: sulfatase [Candidatus Glassbacteria bacterium]
MSKSTGTKNGWKAVHRRQEVKITRNCSILFLFISIAQALILAAGCGKKPPDVILIMIDTLRADHLSCYDKESIHTPNIDSMAEDGFLFGNIHCSAPTTLASTSSLMTSLHPRMHGAARNGFVLDNSLLTLPEVFRERGYSTAAFIASFALHSSTGIDQGFSYFDERFTSTLKSAVLQRRAEDVNDAVTGWLEAAPSRPLFLFIHYFDPHQPYQPPAPYDQPSDSLNAPGITGSMEEVKSLRGYLARGGDVDDRVRRMHELYVGEIHYTDRAVGDLITLLERKKLYDSSLIIFTADHGETFWEHPRRESLDHGYTVYETTTHVPLIIRWPGKIQPGRSDILASNIDIAPTILDLIGMDIPEAFQGRSLKGVIGGETVSEIPVYSEATKPHEEIELEVPFRNDRKAKCIISGRWKLIWVPFMQDHEELYDIFKDPLETTNLISKMHDEKMTGNMRHLLRGWAAEVSEVAKNRPVVMDEETRKKLEALGYIQ